MRPQAIVLNFRDGGSEVIFRRRPPETGTRWCEATSGGECPMSVWTTSAHSPSRWDRRAPPPRTPLCPSAASPHLQVPGLSSPLAPRQAART
jgi:hypothetical protein